MVETFVVAPDDAIDPLILAIDVGTSSARAIVYDAQGRAVRSWEAHRPYDVTVTRDGGVVVEPDFLIELVGSAIDAVLEAMTKRSRHVAAVACDTFWHSLTGVDANEQALTPVYTWADTRSDRAATELRHRLDERAVHARTGATLHSSYLPAKLLWLSQSDPALANAVSYWMSFGEYLYLRLFGERRVSFSMASGTGLLDENQLVWDQALIDVLPIHRDQLSPLANYYDAMCGLRPPYKDRWPALAGIPWYLPMGDGGCNNVGSGGFCEDWPVAMIGTSGALRVVRAAHHVDIPDGLWTYRVDRRRFVQGGAFSAGGNIFAWLEDTMRLGPIAALERELAHMAPDAHGLTVLPFLAGERSPHWNPEARGTFTGIRLDTKPIDIVRATLEAIAYRFGLVYRIMRAIMPPPKGIIASGAGLIHSPAWMQIMSDVLGERVLASAVPEASSRGAALLALEALGTIPDLGAVPSPLGTEYRPDPQHTEIYRRAAARQEELYRVLIEEFERERAVPARLEAREVRKDTA